MTVASVSNSSTTQMLISQLDSQSSTLNTLTQQLASGKQNSNLTDYSPSDAVNLLNLQSSATQMQAYTGVISTVQSRLSAYDTTMTDMESIVSQAGSLVDGNQSYNPATASSLAATAQNYLKSVQIDLNQQINGRYIYAGSRYSTPPVVDFSTITGAPSATILTDGASLPTYDTAYTASQLTLSTSGQNITISGTVTTPQNVSVVVNGTTYTYAVQSGDTTTAIASGLASLISPTVSGTTSSTNTLTIGASGVLSTTSANMTNSAAYATDSATIASGYAVPYGVSSDNPAFQQMIAGLQFLQAAGNSTNATTYAANIKNASTLLSSATNSLQAVHTGVANNINTLTTEKATQTTQLTAIADQVSNIQSVDVTQVSTEITALQTILEASYMVTGALEKLSIVTYL